ncbi:NAD-binding protein [Methanofollis formosanus]|nr:NAD-binding protein [Methanofollis formosanus]
MGRSTGSDLDDFIPTGWCIIIALAAFIVMLGYWGFSIAYAAAGEAHTANDLLYYTLQLFVLQSGGQVLINNWQLDVARFLAPLLTFSTLLIVLWMLMDRLRTIKLLFYPGHVVICGCGYLGPSIARHYLDRGVFVAIIERDPLNREIEACRALGAEVFIGDATREDLLKKARVHRARDIFVVTGNDEVNTEIAMKCRDIAGNSRVRCHLHLEDPLLYRAFLLSTARVDRHGAPFAMEFFNLYQIAGYCIQKEHPSFTAEEQSGSTAHLLVLGLGRMGETLIVQTVKKWKKTSENSSRITVTCIDRDAERKRDLMLWRHPSLAQYCDLKVVEMDLASLEFQRGDFLCYGEEKPFSRVYICIDDSSIGVSTALTLNQRPAFADVPIVVRSTHEDGITRLFETFRTSPIFSNVFSFPLVASECCMEMIVGGSREILGRAIHEHYRELRIKDGSARDADEAMKPWRELRSDLRESNRKQADQIRKKLAAIACSIAPLTDWDERPFTFSKEEIEMLAEMEHERWMDERVAEGWTYGREKDVERKISPYLVPYVDLSEEIKEYDRVAVRIIPALLARVDMKIVRLERGGD